MKWNYKANLPVEGSFRRTAYNPDRVKEIMEEYEVAGTEEMMPLIESVGYDIDEFMLQKLYKSIPDVIHPNLIVMLAFQFDEKPFLRDYFFDIANSYWDVFYLPKGYCWHNENEPVQVMDIVTRLYFADSEKDIWDMVYDLPDYVEDNLSRLYDGKEDSIFNFPICLKQEGKALEMDEYLSSKHDKQSPIKNIEISIDHCHIIGRVRLLREDSMIVSIIKPIRHSIGVTVPERCRGKVHFMTKDEDGYSLTYAGEDNAITTLRQLYYEEKDILSDLDKVWAMLADYHRRELERLKKWGSIMTKEARQEGAITRDELLGQIQYEYYPDLRRIEFDTDFIKELEKTTSKI